MPENIIELLDRLNTTYDVVKAGTHYYWIPRKWQTGVEPELLWNCDHLTRPDLAALTQAVEQGLARSESGRSNRVRYQITNAGVLALKNQKAAANE